MNFGPARVPVVNPRDFGNQFIPMHEYLYWRDYFAHRKSVKEAADAKAAADATVAASAPTSGDSGAEQSCEGSSLPVSSQASSKWAGAQHICGMKGK